MSCHGYLDTDATKSDETIKAINTYLTLTESIILAKIIIPRELNQKNLTVKPSYINGPHPELSILHLLKRLLTTTPLPSLPSHFSRQTESLKGLHWPQLALQLTWPFASLTCSGPCRPPAAGLPYCIWIQDCQSFVSSPSMALNGEKRGSRAGRGQEGRARRPHKEDDEDEKQEEETYKWRMVELQKLALRIRPVHYLMGFSSHNRTPTQ